MNHIIEVFLQLSYEIQFPIKIKFTPYIWFINKKIDLIEFFYICKYKLFLICHQTSNFIILWLFSDWIDWMHSYLNNYTFSDQIFEKGDFEGMKLSLDI